MRGRVAVLGVVGVVIACGARTGLLAPDAGPPPVDAADVFDAPVDVELSGDACTTHCSPDLHEVLDCHGNVLQTCAADQGCNGTGCSEACLAAQANQSTVGCEFYTIDPDVIDMGQGACFAAFVANTWTTPVTLAVDRNATTFDPAAIARVPSGSGKSLAYGPLPNGVIAPGDVAILFLARFGDKVTSCPAGITPAVTAVDAAVHGTGRGHAFHITATAPVVAYSIFPYGGGESALTTATLLLPSSPLATNFVAVAPFDKDLLVSEAARSLAIVGTQAGTAVTITPTHAIAPGPGVDGAQAGVPTTYTVGAGEELQFTQDDDLGGSVIQSSQPIMVYAGATCMNIGVSDFSCDVAHQQLPPVRALGSEYAAVRYRNRYAVDEVVPWRMMGFVDGTSLTFDPPIAGAPATLAKGQAAMFWTSTPFVVRSQDAAHPFYVSGHMTGWQSPMAGGNLERGDPEFVNVVPARQYLATYTFFTDPTYPETDLVVVRRRNAQNAFDDVTLDCAGTLTGWQTIGSSAYQFTRVDLVRGTFVPQGKCDNGRHVMSSASPFGLTVWGWGNEDTSTIAVSYAYPAGESIAPINDVVVSP